MTRVVKAARRLDAAGGKRAAKLSAASNINNELLTSNYTIRARARGAMLNNPLVRNAVENIVGEVVRTGVMTASTNEVAAEVWESFNKSADYDGRTSFDGLLAEIVRSVIVDGEAFVQLLESADADGDLSIRLIMSDQVDESKTARLQDGGYIVQGVQFSKEGIREGYWIRPYCPTDIFPNYPESVFYPVEDILHVFKPVSAGQVRGLSWLAPCLLSAGELDQAVDALIVAVKMSAMHAVIVTDQNDQSADDPYAPPSELSPGSIVKLPAGMTATISNPQQFTTSQQLIRQISLQIAAGLGVPEHFCNGDLSNANYSSLRAGLLPFRQRVEQFQTTVLEPQLLNPIWDKLFPLYVPPAWLWPAFQQVDPAKTISADVAEIQAGLASRSQKITERGFYPAAVDDARAADLQREKALGLSENPTNKGEQSSPV